MIEDTKAEDHALLLAALVRREATWSRRDERTCQLIVRGTDAEHFFDDVDRDDAGCPVLYAAVRDDLRAALAQAPRICLCLECRRVSIP